MHLRQWLRMILSVITVFAVLGGAPFTPPVNGGSPADKEFDDATPDTPLPPGISERVFIHLPRTYKPNHLGTCVPTTNDAVNTYQLAGWRLPTGGITWYLNPDTVPSSVGVSLAFNALSDAFVTWTAADPQKTFSFGGYTSVTRPRLDFVNAVLWGKIPATAIAITYIRYYTSTGIVADRKSTRLNSSHIQKSRMPSSA